MCNTERVLLEQGTTYTLYITYEDPMCLFSLAISGLVLVCCECTALRSLKLVDFALN